MAAASTAVFLAFSQASAATTNEFWQVYNKVSTVEGKSVTTTYLQTVDITTGKAKNWTRLSSQGSYTMNEIAVPQNGVAVYSRSTSNGEVAYYAATPQGKNEHLIIQGTVCGDGCSASKLTQAVVRGNLTSDGKYFSYTKGGVSKIVHTATGAVTLLPLSKDSSPAVFSPKGTYALTQFSSRPDGHLGKTVYEIQYVKLTDLANVKKITGQATPYTAVAFSPDETHFATISNVYNAKTRMSTERVSVRDTATGKVAATYSVQKFSNYGSNSLVWLTNNTLAVLFNNNFTGSTSMIYRLRLSNGTLTATSMYTYQQKTGKDTLNLIGGIGRIDDSSILVDQYTYTSGTDRSQYHQFLKVNNDGTKEQVFYRTLSNASSLIFLGAKN